MFQAEKQQIPKGQSRGRTQVVQPAWALGTHNVTGPSGFQELKTRQPRDPEAAPSWHLCPQDCDLGQSDLEAHNLQVAHEGPMQVPPTDQSPRAPRPSPRSPKARRRSLHSPAFKAASTCASTPPPPPATGHWAPSSGVSSVLTACTLPGSPRGSVGVKVTGQAL